MNVWWYVVDPAPLTEGGMDTSNGDWIEAGECHWHRCTRCGAVMPADCKICNCVERA